MEAGEPLPVATAIVIRGEEAPPATAVEAESPLPEDPGELPTIPVVVHATLVSPAQYASHAQGRLAGSHVGQRLTRTFTNQVNIPLLMPLSARAVRVGVQEAEVQAMVAPTANPLPPNQTVLRSYTQALRARLCLFPLLAALFSVVAIVSEPQPQLRCAPVAEPRPLLEPEPEPEPAEPWARPLFCYYEGSDLDAANASITWEVARDACWAIGADLASIHSTEENAEAYALRPPGRAVWLGLIGHGEVPWDGENWGWSSRGRVFH
jgi:hypothetical protein